MTYTSYDSPPSSPASSPSPYVDSSPLSSPATNYLELDDRSCANDPYAGSVKATKLPRLYEKKRSRPISPSPSPDTKKSRISAQGEVIERELAGSARSESEIWSDVVARVIDNGHGHVDLENRSLTSIPSQAILDLNMLYVPSDVQERQMENSYGRSKSFNRVKSIATEHWGFPRENIQLLLGWNSLTYLPQEIFNLRKLTVLSLRFNKLSILPPEIGQLSSLNVLNLSNNKLLFLPSELMQMNLQHLQIFPNPFLPPPRNTLPRTYSFARSKSRSKMQSEDKLYSPTIPIFRDPVIPLFELSLRRLLSPAPDSSDQKICLLEETYELPLSEQNESNDIPGTKRAFWRTLPPLVRDILDATHYGSVYVESTENPPGSSQSSSLPTGSQTFYEFEAYLKERLHSLTSYDTEYQRVTGKGMCCSPRHAGLKLAFVVPAEERFTWEHTVAGVPNLGQVPIRWRGCQRGCLDFLSPQPREPGPLAVAPALDGGHCMEDIVQHVELSSGFAFDGFGD